MTDTIEIMAEFAPINRSPYMVGDVEMVDPAVAISRLYMHGETGQVRLYSNDDMDGTAVSVNGADPVTMKKRGRFGRLYIGYPQDGDEE